jgi:hypothetical protein
MENPEFTNLKIMPDFRLSGSACGCVNIIRIQNTNKYAEIP